MRRLRLAIEFVLLFAALPLAYRYDLVPLPLFPALWLLAAGCLVTLLHDPEFPRRRLWDPARLRERAAFVVVPFLACAPLLAVALLLAEPERLFAFPRQRPLLWALVMVLYPVLSVYPQGLVYRTFVFHRYRTLFPSPWALVLASALAFAAIHVVFRNWVAPPLSFLGGLLFAATYARTSSALAAAVQHALFGCWLFTLGIGHYFYYGAVRG